MCLANLAGVSNEPLSVEEERELNWIQNQLANRDPILHAIRVQQRMLVGEMLDDIESQRNRELQ